jgi:hypothetical protein
MIVGLIIALYGYMMKYTLRDKFINKFDPNAMVDAEGLVNYLGGNMFTIGITLVVFSIMFMIFKGFVIISIAFFAIILFLLLKTLVGFQKFFKY